MTLLMRILPYAIIGIGLLFYFQYVRKQAYEKALADIAVADAKNESIQKGHFNDLQSKSDYDFCVDRLKRRSMPTDPCEQLLGVR